MKNIWIFILFMTSTTLVFAQVDRENVLVEIGTGTWCPYCPGAAMGADDMIANGLDVAIIENHNGDDYANVYSNTRNSYYNISGYPTAVFDGLNQVVGGSSSQSMYPQYLQKYNQRINVPSDFTIEFVEARIGFTDFEFVVNVEKVNGNYGELRLHAALTESEIQESWQGMDELNFVNRLMVPNQNGTTLDFSTNSSYEVTLNFPLNPSWIMDHCEVVFFIQNNSTKEIYQGVKSDLSEMGTSNLDYNIAIGEIQLPRMVCHDELLPRVQIGNFGQQTITSLLIEYSINDGEVMEYTWAGSLETDQMEFVDLPLIAYEIIPDNSFEIAVSDLNGEDDEYPENNSGGYNFEEAQFLSSPLHMDLKLDAHPEETSWNITDSNGEIVYSGGPYDTPNVTIYQHFYFPYTDCFTFNIYDEGGDGLTGSGKYLIYNNSYSFIEIASDFGYHDAFQVNIDEVSAVEEINKDSVEIYPNPFSESFSLDLSLQKDCKAEVILYNSTGQQVLHENVELFRGQNTHQFIAEEWVDGVYFFHLVSDGTVMYQQKLLLIR